MICALEANTEVLAYEVAQAERERIERERIKKELAEAKQTAIIICETEIAERIRSFAEIGRRSCSFSYSMQMVGAVRIGRKLQAEKRSYADGRGSYRPSGVLFDLDAIAEYLRAHCYKVEFKKDGYWSYGWGWRSDAVEVCISW